MCGRDWSSDVCSSDLVTMLAGSVSSRSRDCGYSGISLENSGRCSDRSEERRVGKEGGFQGSGDQEKKERCTNTAAVKRRQLDQDRSSDRCDSWRIDVA